jgi:hypothetical protein
LPYRLLVAGALASVACAQAAVASPPPSVVADPAPISALRIEVNVPAFRLDAYLHHQLVASYPITAGSTWEPTHTGRFELREVVWNPWWHPPAHRRPKDRVTPPGPRNPMGRVKLPFHGLYYIHGTHRDTEIGRPASRGCVRLRNEDAIALARLIHQHGSPSLSPAEVDRLAADPRRTRTVRLELPVSVEVGYRLVEVRDGGLAVYRDIYRQETRSLAELASVALGASGAAAAAVDWLAVDSALAALSHDLPQEGGWVPLRPVVEVTDPELVIEAAGPLAARSRDGT